jgi:hypothetical protein
MRGGAKGGVRVWIWAVCAAVCVSGLAAGCIGKILGTNGIGQNTAAECSGTPLPGHTMIHRLDNVEYNNVVRDLLYTTSQPANLFESSSVGASGFTNESDVLTLSDQIVAEYMAAAQSLADEVVASEGVDGGAFALLAGCAGATATPSAACVQTVIQAFGQRAFRHPLDPDDLQRLMTVYAGESSFTDGFHDVIVAVLIDPMFLFSYIKHPSPDDPAVIAQIDDYALASRLSFAVWESMPDDALLALAAQNTLHEQANIQAQVKRMLADPRAVSFATTWRRDWGHLTLLDGDAGYGGVPSEVTSDLIQEPQLVVQDMIANDSSFLTLVNGDQTFVNQDVASYYGWNLPNVTSSTFQKVPIPDPNRRGILTEAALMLTIGGGETYTHPVQRGRWVLDSLLCSAPGAPPADVPSLDTTTPSNLPMRQRLAEHTASPFCSSCHEVMDVYGLGLENFDMEGKWRSTYAALNNLPIDASGVLPDGGTFSGPQQMLALLAEDPGVRACLAEKLMTYALARPMDSDSDQCVAQALGAQDVQPTSHLSDLFTDLAMSPQFQMQQGASP